VNCVPECVALDETHDAAARSWLASANGETDFPLQNLPFAVFSTGDGGTRRVGVGLGDCIIDLAKLQQQLEGRSRAAAKAADSDSLNALMALGHATTDALRQDLFRLFRDGTNAGVRPACESALVPLNDATLHRPVRIGGFTDFFASVHHATNAGRIFRPDAPLLPNYKCFLEDGDELVLRGRCERAGFIGIGFGECRAVVLPA
jgi:fumarylacetoacetase